MTLYEDLRGDLGRARSAAVSPASTEAAAGDSLSVRQHGCDSLSRSEGQRDRRGCSRQSVDRDGGRRSQSASIARPAASITTTATIAIRTVSATTPCMRCTSTGTASSGSERPVAVSTAWSAAPRPRRQCTSRTSRVAATCRARSCAASNRIATTALWLSTNNGLTRLDPRLARCKIFHEAHGLQGEDFNFNAHYRGRDGTLYFGGNDGFNAFRPKP